MKADKVLAWMTLFNDKIQANKDYLSELDTPIGDGDHGGNMARGMAAVMEELAGKSYQQASHIFKTVGMQLLSKVGGASGPLYGSAFIGMSKVADDERLVECLQAGLEMIIKRGKANPGEKTMVDVWTPVVADLQAGLLKVEAIQAYAEKTKDLVASKGRASYVGERSLGHLDPGAYSSALLFQALVEVGGLDD
ncbi:dihydroxyacetone kinase subunit DhaL [Streptococcus cuniculipharyngis]|uniref:phosphoenolpyruvate--glycerone phosphotransferase n=1 Tax=Streptococcus cuniculipharyngis TaxID=1562651 RepID=A0A5C5SDA1_9STRE|nr:dihydroxyacetone kinase subunit DhaL [Streptococcus cuniculipharyngis]TWS99067.1 dihydroxyacetone kinase subunit L [Streptococcus cuniculipharyngis]